MSAPAMILTLGTVEIRLEAGEVLASRAFGERQLRVVTEEQLAARAEEIAVETGLSPEAALEDLAQYWLTWDLLAIWGVPVPEVKALSERLAFVARYPGRA